MEKPSPLEKNYEPVPQVPPAILPKPSPDGKIDSSQDFYLI